MAYACFLLGVFVRGVFGFDNAVTGSTRLRRLSRSYDFAFTSEIYFTYTRLFLVHLCAKVRFVFNHSKTVGIGCVSRFQLFMRSNINHFGDDVCLCSYRR